LLAFPPGARAIDFVLVWDDLDENPSWDPNGTQLMQIAQAAAARWERLIDSSGTHEVDVSWSFLDPGELGRWKFDPFGNNNLYFNANASWFVDPTPGSDEEFDFGDPLDLLSTPGSEIVEFFDPIYSYFDQATPPATLEIAYWGNGISGTGADSAWDLLSVVLHEMGHELGIAGDEFSGRYAIYPHHVNGIQDLEVIEQDNKGNEFGEEHGHLAPPEALMSPNSPGGRRVLPSAVDVLAAARDSGYTEVDLVRKFSGRSGDYDDPLLWIGGQVPNSFDDVYIVDGHTVTLDGIETADDLYVSRGGVLATGVWDLTVDGEILVDGNGEIRVQGGGDLTANRIEVRPLGEVVLSGGTLAFHSGEIQVDDQFHWIGSLHGHGTLDVGGQLVVTGRLDAEGGLLEITGPGSLRFTSNETFQGGLLSVQNGDLELGVAISTSSVDGVISVGEGRRITLLEDVTFPSGVELYLGGSGASPALLTSFGSDVDATIHNLSAGANARIEALRTTLAGHVDVSQAGNVLTLASPQGTTFLGTGIFGDGTLRQAGDISVLGAVGLHVDTFDWGNSTSTQSNDLVLSPNSVLTIHSDSLGSSTGIYRGLIQVDSAVLDVRTDGGWTLPNSGFLGVLQPGRLAMIHSGAADPVVRGAPLTLGGSLLVAGGDAFIESELTTTGSSEVFVFGNSTLFLDGHATLGGGSFGGDTLVQADDITVTGDTTIEVDTFAWGRSLFGVELHTLEVAEDATLTINSPGTGDPDNDFRGVLRLDGGDLVVNTDLPWTLPAAGFLRVGGRLEMNNPDFVSAPSISGQSLTIGGDVVVSGSGESNINADLAFLSTATTTIESGAVLNLNGATSYGSASFGGDGLLRHAGTAFFGGDELTVSHFAQNGVFTFGDPDDTAELVALTTVFESEGTTRLFADLTLHGDAVIEGGHVFTGGDDLVVARGASLSGANGNVGVSLVNEGHLAPGFSPGVFEIGGDYTQSATGSLSIELGGLLAGIQHDVLSVSGDMVLAGELELILLGGFEPTVGDVFDVLDWGGLLSGAFDSFAFGPGTSLVEWNFGSLYTTGAIRFVPEPSTLALVGAGLAAMHRGARRRGARR
jgi:hypothetical protein